MALTTTAHDIPFRSPLAGMLDNYATGSAEQARTRVGLADASGRGLLRVRGREADSALRPIWNNAPAAVGDVARVEEGALARLRADEFLFMGLNPSAEIGPLEARIAAAPHSGVLTVTDVTHGFGLLRLVGRRAPDVLPKLCGLDFADAAFPDCHAAQTSLAKITALIARLDESSSPAYWVMVERSLAAYVWDTVWAAMREFDGARLNAHLPIQGD
jgi:heterotetrameric sarcosine oxidase gamma subunit